MKIIYPITLVMFLLCCNETYSQNKCNTDVITKSKRIHAKNAKNKMDIMRTSYNVCKTELNELIEKFSACGTDLGKNVKAGDKAAAIQTVKMHKGEMEKAKLRLSASGTLEELIPLYKNLFLFYCNAVANLDKLIAILNKYDQVKQSIADIREFFSSINDEDQKLMKAVNDELTSLDKLYDFSKK